MSLFRKEAIRQYMDPDARGGVLKVAPPSGLRIFAVLAALFVLAGVVAVTQSVSVTANGRGVVRPRGGVRLVRAPRIGRVLRMHVSLGERVAAGDALVTLAVEAPPAPPDEGPIADLLAKQRAEVAVLAKVGEKERAEVLAAANADLEESLARARREKARSPSDEATVIIKAPIAGVIDRIPMRIGEMVEAGSAVAKLVPDDELVAYMTIEGRHRSELEPGRKVRLKLDEHPSEEAGFGVARVRRISSDAIDPASCDPLLAPTLAAASAPMHQLDLELEAMPPRAAGGFVNGMAFTGEVVLREQRIITILFPPLARLFDGG